MTEDVSARCFHASQLMCCMQANAQKQDEIIGRLILDMVRISPGSDYRCGMCAIMCSVDWQPEPMASLVLPCPRFCQA